MYLNVAMVKDKVDVLLVEDNLDDSEFTRYAFATANNNLSLRHFTNAEEALEFIFDGHTYWNQPATDSLKLIVLDLNLPSKLGGFDIVSRIRNEERTKSIPIVVLSYSEDESDIHHAYELGVNSYVVKPLEFNRFVKKIASMASYWSTVNERMP